MGFYLKDVLSKNVWQLVTYLILSQVLVLNADQPFTYSGNALDEKETHPIRLDIHIYKADRLPISENYVTTKQIEDSHAELVADLDFSFHLKSGFTAKEETLKAVLKAELLEKGKSLGLDVKLAVPELENLDLEAQLECQFGDELIQEFSSQSDQKIIYVIVMKFEKLNWIKEELAIKEKELADIKNILEKLKGSPRFSLRPYKVKIAPEIGTINKVNRAAYLEKLKKNRNVEYQLKQLNLSDLVPLYFAEPVIIKNNPEPVYDLSSWFGCDVKDQKQWVHFDSNTKKLIGSVDGIIEVKLRMFVLENSFHDKSLLRTSADLIMVDMKAAETVANIKLLEKQGRVKRLQSWSQFSDSISSQSLAIKTRETEIVMSCEPDLSGFPDLQVSVKNKTDTEKLSLSSSFPLGRCTVVRCAASYGEAQNMKCLLMVRVDKLDAYDRSKKALPQTDPFLQFTEIEKIDEQAIGDPFDEGRVYHRYKTNEVFYDLIKSSGSIGDIGSESDLMTTPDHAVFEANDLVFNIRRLFIDQGTPLEKDDIVIFNQNKEELIYSVNSVADLTIDSILQHIKLIVVPEIYKTTVQFYEVDLRDEQDSEWDVGMLLQSNPIPIGSAGLPGEGEIHSDRISIEVRSQDTSEDDFSIDYKLKYREEVISNEVSVDMKLGSTRVVEIKRGAKRSIVAMIVMEKMR